MSAAAVFSKSTEKSADADRDKSDRDKSFYKNEYKKYKLVHLALLNACLWWPLQFLKHYRMTSASEL